jgi:small conductance mechanosensitive channel
MTLRTPFDADFAQQAAVARKLADALGDFAVNLFIAALILILTLWISGWAAHAVRRGLERFSKTRDDRTLQTFGSSVVRVAVLIVGFIAVLTRLGVETTSIIAILGAASLAIGLALQGALANVAAGVMLLVLRPYKVGDFVEVSGRQGTVKSLKLFTTELDTLDNVRITAPNGKVFGDLITNFTAHGERRVDIAFTVNAEEDLEQALTVLRGLAEAHPKVRTQPAPIAEVTEMTDGYVRVALRAWTALADVGPVRSDLFVTARRALAEAGFRPAYPRQVAVPHN